VFANDVLGLHVSVLSLSLFFLKRKSERFFYKILLKISLHFLSLTPTSKEIMACPLRHYLGYFYWLAALVGAIAVVFGMKDSRLYDVSSGGSDESSSKTAKKKR
jgi:hypothetical protein